jgi:hypothetical protein
VKSDLQLETKISQACSTKHDSVAADALHFLFFNEKIRIMRSACLSTLKRRTRSQISFKSGMNIMPLVVNSDSYFLIS